VNAGRRTAGSCRAYSVEQVSESSSTDLSCSGSSVMCSSLTGAGRCAQGWRHESGAHGWHNDVPVPAAGHVH
jgi:hypothetical protein